MKSGRERVRKAEVMGRYVAKGVTPISPRVLEVHVNKQPGQEKVVVTDRRDTRYAFDGYEGKEK